MELKKINLNGKGIAPTFPSALLSTQRKSSGLLTTFDLAADYQDQTGAVSYLLCLQWQGCPH